MPQMNHEKSNLASTTWLYLDFGDDFADFWSYAIIEKADTHQVQYPKIGNIFRSMGGDKDWMARPGISLTKWKLMTQLFQILGASSP